MLVKQDQSLGIKQMLFETSQSALKLVVNGDQLEEEKLYS